MPREIIVCCLVDATPSLLRERERPTQGDQPLGNLKKCIHTIGSFRIEIVIDQYLFQISGEEGKLSCAQRNLGDKWWLAEPDFLQKLRGVPTDRSSVLF